MNLDEMQAKAREITDRRVANAVSVALFLIAEKGRDVRAAATTGARRSGAPGRVVEAAVRGILTD